MKKPSLCFTYCKSNLLMLLVSLVICFINEVSANAMIFPSKDTMKSWSESLDQKFDQMTSGSSDITGAYQLKQVYQQKFNGQILQTDGKQIAEDMREKIKSTFNENIDALRNLQVKAEDAIKTYKYNQSLQLGNINYTNVRRPYEDWPQYLKDNMEYNEHFKQQVNVNESGVHIPIEIYEGYPDMLNEINWSKQLEEVFMENRKLYPEIYWQSFGSQKGMLRIYPLARWETPDDLPDLFDVRRRPWYIHGTSSPKDVVILLDKSGSMHGQSLKIMKIAAKTLINTLGENDYVNVASFPSTDPSPDQPQIEWVTECMNNTLVQANTRNKKLLFDGIDALEARYVASYKKAVEFAYHALGNFTKQSKDEENIGTGADCHKLIMMFSDGFTENEDEELMQKLNEKHIRIFSYAVGPHPLPVTALNKMACDTNGSYTHIATTGAIRTQIQDYARVLSKPQVLKKNQGTYEEYLRHTFFQHDRLGLGFTSTMTLPVFNNSISADNDNQTLAGIVGVDIPVSRFETFAPRDQLGPFGYSFGMNTNGFLIFHPSLSYRSLNYLEDPHHNDFNEMEGDSEQLIQLRKELIDLAYNPSSSTEVKTKSVSISKIIQHGHTIPLDMEYHYAAIDKTEFSFGVVVPKDRNYAVIPPNANDIKAEIKEVDKEKAFIAPWNYCQENKDIWDYTDSFETLNATDTTCTGRMASHLAWDIRTATETFNSLPLTNNEDYPSRFVMTDGGLILYNNGGIASSNPDQYKQDPYNSTIYRFTSASSTPTIFLQQFKLPVSPCLSKYSVVLEEDEIEESFPTSNSSLESEEDYTMVNVTDSESNPEFVEYNILEPTLHLVNTIKITENGGPGSEFIAGISGIELSHQYLKNLVMEFTTTANTESEFNCANNNTKIWCYFIDLSGYILSSNQDETDVKVGNFLGLEDPSLMRHLIEDKNYFDERPVYDYAALCENPVDCSSEINAAASSQISFLLSLPMKFAISFLKSSVTFLYELNITVLSTFLTLWLPKLGEASLFEFYSAIPEGCHRCTTKTSNWYLKPELFQDGENSVLAEFYPCDISKMNEGANKSQEETFKESGEDVRSIENSSSSVKNSKDLNNKICEKEDIRRYHLYRMQNINAILIVVDPPEKPHKFDGKREEYGDGPIEDSSSGDSCLLPPRYRKRPKNCYSYDEREIYECNKGSMGRQTTLHGTLLFVMAALYFSQKL